MPFPLTDAQLDALLEEIPAVAGRPRQLEELSGGLTNRNVKVTTPDAVYVARCVDTSCNFLAIDRDEEYHNSVAAERAGASGASASQPEYQPSSPGSAQAAATHPHWRCTADSRLKGSAGR